MQTYISVLRGINVSGRNMIKMDALRNMFEQMRFKHVKTYIQSGNVVFQTKKVSNQKLEQLITEKIVDCFSFDVPVLVKELSEIEEVLSNNPFILRQEDPAKLHVTFLSDFPEQERVAKITSGQYASDEFIIKGKDVYVYCPDGYGNTKLSNNFFESKLKVTATTRNWKTVTELAILGKGIL